MPYVSNVAFLAGSVGTGEWIVLFVVVLIVVGPKRLPEIARKIGRTMEMFRRAADEFKEQLMSMDQEPHVPSAPTTYSSDDYTDPYTDASDYPGYEDHDAGYGDHGVSSESGGGADEGGDDSGGGDGGNATLPSDDETEDQPKAPEGEV